MFCSFQVTRSSSFSCLLLLFMMQLQLCILMWMRTYEVRTVRSGGMSEQQMTLQLDSAVRQGSTTPCGGSIPLHVHMQHTHVCNHITYVRCNGIHVGHTPVEMGAVCFSLKPSHSLVNSNKPWLRSPAALWKALLLRCSWHRRAHVQTGRCMRDSRPGNTVYLIVFSGIDGDARAF